MGWVEHALRKLLVGNPLTKEAGDKLLGQSGRAEPHAGLDSDVASREFRP
jgi:hypothetical protein